jgi:PAS domain S-box-containing protein
MSQGGSTHASARGAKSFSASEPYLIGLLGVVLATLVRSPFEGVLEGQAPYALYYLPILYVAWRYGLPPTVVTVLGSLLAVWLFVIPERFSFVKSPSDYLSLVLFALVSAAMALLSRKAASLREQSQRNDQACRRAERAADAAVWDMNVHEGEFHAVALNGLFGIEGSSSPTSAKRIEDLVHPEDRSRYRQSWALARTSREPVRVEYRVQHPTRGARWFASIGQASAAHEGSAWMSGITLDITERKQAEMAAAAQREWFRVTLRSIGDAVIACDREGLVTFINPVAEQLTGWPAAEALGEPLANVFRILNENTRVPVENPADKVLREGVVIGLANHTALIARNGVERPIADSAAPIHDEDGSIQGVILVFHDVTKERRDADAVAEQREWFETTLESIGDAVIATDVRGRIVFMNPVAEYLTGWRLDQAEGRACEEVFRIANETTRSTVESPVGRVLREGNVVGLANHTVLIASNGIERPIDDSGSPIRSRDGRIVGVVLVFRDVSEKRAVDQEKQASALQRERLLESERYARSDAERANRLKDEFVATVSHELRTPLNAIVGWVHVLQHGPADPTTLARALDVIERNARVQRQLISDLLDISSILSGKIRLEVQIVELEPILEAALETVRPSAEAKRIVLERHIEPLPRVMGDPGRLQQVVWNLLSNAVKFTPEGGRVTLVARRVDSQAEIAVTDTGIGIRGEFLGHVFERFRQGDSSMTRRFGGLGLGLSIVKQLVELHGGSVAAESDGEDRGSTFRVRLPIGELREVGPRPGSGGDPCEQMAEIAMERLKLLRVLVVEDQPDTRELVLRLLEECGAVASTASTGSEALTALSGGQFDLLISDIGLPGMDGYALIRAVRDSAEPRVARIPAIALTAFAQPDDRTRAMRAGYQAYLVKPMDPAELIATVASLADLIERREDEKRG